MQELYYASDPDVPPPTGGADPDVPPPTEETEDDPDVPPPTN